MFEEQLHYTFAPEEIEQLRVVFTLMNVYEKAYYDGYKPDFFGMEITFATMESILNRPLTQLEKDNYTAIKFIMMIAMFESEFQMVITPDLRADFEIYFTLMNEYNTIAEEGFPNFFTLRSFELEARLGRTLSSEEAGVLIMVRSMMTSAQLEATYSVPLAPEITSAIPLVLAILEAYDEAWNALTPEQQASYPPMAFAATDEVIAELIGISALTPEQSAALTLAKQIGNSVLGLSYDLFVSGLENRFGLVFTEADEVHLLVVYDLVIPYASSFDYPPTPFFDATFIEIEIAINALLSEDQKNKFVLC